MPIPFEKIYLVFSIDKVLNSYRKEQSIICWSFFTSLKNIQKTNHVFRVQGLISTKQRGKEMCFVDPAQVRDFLLNENTSPLLFSMM